MGANITDDSERRTDEYTPLLLEIGPAPVDGHESDLCASSGDIDCSPTVTFPQADELAQGTQHAAEKNGGHAPRTIAQTRIGRFDVLREIGRGGHGVVFLARDPMLKRLIALKVPRPEVVLTPTMLENFLAEGQAAALLTHPNVVTVYEAGKIHPHCYLAQAYVPGPTLAAWLRSQPGGLSPRMAAAIVAQLADGIEHAHARGVLHRDLKPGNVLLETHCADDAMRDGKSDEDLPFTPKIADFGIAKTLGADPLENSGVVFGTPSYMSPEQASGGQEHVGPASDVYSLGTILHELLTGNFPSLGDTCRATVKLVGNTTVVRHRRRPHEAPRDLRAICLKCLEKDPQSRYVSAFALAADLRRFLAGEPTQARPLMPHDRLAKWARRQPGLAAMAGSIVAVTVLFLAVLLSYNSRLTKALNRALQQEAIASDRGAEAFVRAYSADMRMLDESWATAPGSTVESLLDSYLPTEGRPDPRGFEWWLYQRLMHNDVISKQIGFHEGGVHCVAVSPKGDIAASGGLDGIIRLWDTVSGNLLAELRGHKPDDMNELQFNADGTKLVSASDDNTVGVWDVVGRKLIHRLAGHTGWVSSVVFLPDGKTLASGSADKSIIIWDASSGREIRRLVGHTDAVRALAFHKSSSTLFSAAEDRTIRGWDVDTGTFTTKLPDGRLENPEQNFVRKLAMEPDDNSLMGAYVNAEPVVWKLDRKHFGEIYRRPQLSGHPRSISIQGSAKDPIMAMAMDGPLIRVSRYPREHRDSSILRGHPGRVDAVALLPDASKLISGSKDGSVRLWDFRGSHRVIRKHPSPEKVVAMTISPDGQLIATSTEENHIDVVNFDSLKTVRQISLGDTRAADLAFSPDSRTLAAITFQRSIAVFNVSDADVASEFSLPGAAATNAMIFSPDGRLLVVLKGSTLLVLDVERRSILRTEEFPDRLGAAAFANDDEILITCFDGRLYTVSAREAKPRESRVIEAGDPRAVAVSPDRGRIALRVKNGVEILDLESGKSIASLPQTENNGRLAFLAGGRTLITEEGEAGPQLWNTRTWQRVGSLGNFEVDGQFSASSDGYRLVSKNRRAIVAIDARPGEP